MKKTELFKIFSATAFLTPVVAFGQNFTYIENWLNAGLNILNLSIVIITVLMTFFFLWRVFELITAKSEDKRTEARKAVLNAMIGLFISVAVWGIIRIAGNIIQVDTTGRYDSAPPVTCPPGTIYDPRIDSCAANLDIWR